MKTLIQKLPLETNSSFLAKTFETPHFETPYHLHNEYELMVIKKGYGTAFVGDFIGEYKVGDVYLHGAKLPHWFRKKEKDIIGASMVVQFKDDFLGPGFFDLPEMKSVRKLLNRSARGFYCTGDLAKSIRKQLHQIEYLPDFKRIQSLLDMLYEMSISNEYKLVSRIVEPHTLREQFTIQEVFEYSMNNFKRKITLEEVALLSNKSISAFSHYFKKTTKMSYINFLTQIRIAHACELLKTTNLSVSEICYESGFNNWANFSAHFKKHCNMPPSKYRAKTKVSNTN